MKERPPLRLHEEIMLLSLKDEKGTMTSSETLPYILGAAALAELLLEQRIGIGEPRKKKLVEVLSGKPTGDPILDESLQRIAKAKRRASLKNWVTRIARSKHLKHRVAEELCHKRIVRSEEDTVLLIFKRRLYPEIDCKPERAIIQRLRRAIFTDTRTLDPHTAVLVALAHQAGLLKNAFDKGDLKRRKARLKEIARGEVTAKAAKEAIDAMQAAVMVAAIMPAIAASSAGGR